jgi:hypothetical protein
VKDAIMGEDEIKEKERVWAEMNKVRCMGLCSNEAMATAVFA